MKQVCAVLLILLFSFSAISEAGPPPYAVDSTVPQLGGCPQPNRWNLSLSAPLNRRWSTALPTLLSPTILTAAQQNSPAATAEIQQTITNSFAVWAGVTGTTLNSTAYPGLLAPLGQVSAANSCSDDAEDNVDGLNTICFNQSSIAFTSGVLAFTRTITANVPGAVVGSSAPAAFAGQILDADTLFRNDGQATFATPAALSSPQGQGAYDLESLLIHELGHWLGLDHSAVIRAIMFPFAPPPGQFLGDRPIFTVPDAPLADDDRTGIRAQYPDPNDTLNVGAIRGRIVPANPFALAIFAAPSIGASVTGIVGAHVVAVDADTGSIIAGTLGGWSCDPANPPTRFDGSFDIERLPVGHNYNLYAEPLVGLALPADFSDALAGLCSATVTPTCQTPAANANFNVRVLSSSQ
ncbi:MAG: matrixin family metalloprotease [Candidatus Acidiferrales bacterium]